MTSTAINTEIKTLPPAPSVPSPLEPPSVVDTTTTTMTAAPIKVPSPVPVPSTAATKPPATVITQHNTVTTTAVAPAPVPKPLVAPSATVTAAVPSEQQPVASQLPKMAVPSSTPQTVHYQQTPTEATLVPQPTSPKIPSKSSKKKKSSGQPTVTMATAPASSSSNQGSQGENTGRWTAEEHRLFLQGLEQHGKGWKKIASLIKSRTVVQIRTHAQKYFQKLAKARQNGEEGEIAMDARGGTTSVATGGIVGSHSSSNNKRRRQTTGTKRKAISSVVSSAQRQGKKMAAASGAPNAKPPLPAVAPALAPFIVPNAAPPATQAQAPGTVTPVDGVPSVSSSHGPVSGPALEDSLFRFLTPAPVAPAPDSSNVQVNDVARQAGANPITLPTTDNTHAAGAFSGEISPTGVTDINIYPGWTADPKDMPAWYSKGGDVDSLLDVADTLDWLADTGDLDEIYQPPPVPSNGAPTTTHTTMAQPTSVTVENKVPPQIPNFSEADQQHEVSGNTTLAPTSSVPSLGGEALPSEDCNVPPLPSLFENSDDTPPAKRQKVLSSTELSEAESGAIEEHLNVFDTPMEEHAFVSALLENNGESSASLPVLN